MKMLDVSLIVAVLISLHGCSTCLYSCENYNNSYAFNQNFYYLNTSTTIKRGNNEYFNYFYNDDFKENFSKNKIFILSWKFQIISFIFLDMKTFSLKPFVINNFEITKNYQNFIDSTYREQQSSRFVYDKIIQEKLINRKILNLLRRIEEISKIYFNKINILEKLLNILNEIYEKILKNSSFSQTQLLYVMKECIYNICLKISRALDPKINSNFEFQSKSFIINIISTISNEFQKYKKNFIVEIPIQKAKKTNLLINFPSELLFNNTSKFLFQTIIWKFHQKKHVVSKIFSFDIFNKDTNELMKFTNLSRNFFQFLIPKSHNFKNKFGQKYICQYFNTTMKKWQTDGCHFISFDKNSNKFQCECNHLTEFRVTTQKESEKVLKNKKSVVSFYFIFFEFLKIS